MNEHFLHYLWLHRRFSSDSLVTEEGISLQILYPGEYNRDAGPDFLHARLLLKGMQWVGNIEVHIRSSDWQRHRHCSDPHYANCILHVVWEHDVDIPDASGNMLPTLSLSRFVSESVKENYFELMKVNAAISCRGRLDEVSDNVRMRWLDRMTADWLESRVKIMRRFLDSSRGHWEEAFYHALARAYGFHVNGDPFERLSRSVPLGLLLRNRDRPLTLSALYFGMSGFLDGRYYREADELLRTEYLYLIKKWQLKPPDMLGWKFMRMRPHNFPTRRIAQFLALYRSRSPLLSNCLDAEQMDDILLLLDNQLTDLPLPSCIRSPGIASIGESSKRILLVNTVIPFLFLKGTVECDLSLTARMLDWLENLKPESNAVVRSWQALGWHPRSAGESQGLLWLYNNYCIRKKCLNCEIGNQVICRPLHQSELPKGFPVT